MASRRKKRKKKKKKEPQPVSGKPPPLPVEPRVGRAKPHGKLANELVHVFVDDQNLFYGIVNDGAGRGYRIDFGKLLTEVSKNAAGETRSTKSA